MERLIPEPRIAGRQFKSYNHFTDLTYAKLSDWITYNTSPGSEIGSRYSLHARVFLLCILYFLDLTSSPYTLYLLLYSVHLPQRCSSSTLTSHLTHLPLDATMADEPSSAAAVPALTARDLEILDHAFRNPKSGGEFEVSCSLFIMSMLTLCVG